MTKCTLGSLRGRLRLFSGLVMFAFVLCHLIAHATLLISMSFAQFVLTGLMYVWKTYAGVALLTAAFILHYGNALWSIYIRRSLRMLRWQLLQLALGLSIPLLLALHFAGTGIAEAALDINALYSPILISQWVRSSWANLLQMAAVVVVWIHACIGLHFWLRLQRWYRQWQICFGVAALMVPTLALAGFVSAGNQILRLAQSDPETITLLFDDSNMTETSVAIIGRIALVVIVMHIVLVSTSLAARALRDRRSRRGQRTFLSHSSGKTCVIRSGATVLETLREYGIAHAGVCGGRARCTTCRVRVLKGLEELPAPEPMEEKALARIDATTGVRLACQIRPMSDISVVPLLAADASAADGSVKGGLEGSERLITVMFVDLRDSTALSESRMPYDVLFVLNQFFFEMTQALATTGGHYSQFTGDGLMALYGLREQDTATGPADALRGARDMLLRLDKLNQQLYSEMSQPLRIGIGIHFSEAIVGTMGPPGSRIITAIGDLVNTCARLEGLTKQYDCPVIVSRRAAEAAGLDVADLALHEVQVRGRVAMVEFYALRDLPEVRV
jgi:adenylate cyclase